MRRYLILLFVLMVPFNIMAKENEDIPNTFNVICDKTNININDQIVCRLALTSNSLFNEINYNLNIDDGLDLVDIRSNYEKMWSVTKEKATSSSLVNGLQEFAILLISPNREGEYSISLSNITFKNSNDEIINKIPDFTTKIKVISTDNTLKTIKINDKELSNFNKVITNYTINITDDASIKIEGILNNEFSKVTGNGEFDLSQKVKRFVFPLTVQSENGNNKIYLINVIRNDYTVNEKKDILENISLKDDKNNTLLIGFKNNIFDYNFEVDSNTSSIIITPTLKDDSYKFIKGYEKQTLKLKPGNNLAMVKVRDESGNEIIYTIMITKPLENVSENSYIKELSIKNINLNFSKKVKIYNIYIKKYMDKLEINPILEDENSSYQIVGNENLKEGSVIKIIVTAPNETKTVYQLNISYAKFNYVKLSLIVVIILIICYLINRYIYVLKTKKKKIRDFVKENIVLENKETVNKVIDEKPKENKNPVKTPKPQAIIKSKSSNKQDVSKNNSSSIKKTSSSKNNSIKKNQTKTVSKSKNKTSTQVKKSTTKNKKSNVQKNIK